MDLRGLVGESSCVAWRVEASAVCLCIFPESELCCRHVLSRHVYIPSLLRQMIPVDGMYARFFCMYQTKFRLVIPLFFISSARH